MTQHKAPVCDNRISTGKAMMAPPAAFGSGEVPNRYAEPLEYPSLPWYYDSTLTMYVAVSAIAVIVLIGKVFG